MQQFGFSATDVKLKQWDETPKLAATQTFSPRRYPLARRCLPNYLHPFITETLPKQPSDFVGPKSPKGYQPGMDAHAFSKKIRFWWVRGLGGLAAGKGVSSKL